MPAHARRRNPLAVLFVTVCLLLPVFLAYDHTTPIVFFLLGLFHLLIIGGVDFRKFLKTLSILSLVSLGLFGLNVLVPAEGVNGFSRGTAVLLRSVCLISLSIGYIYVVDPYDLFRSLMLRLQLPPRIGFSLFAGWNTIPLLRRDLKIIQKAQAVRFGSKKRSMRVHLKTAVSLLSGAIRHGERVALSMAARGMESSVKRTFLTESAWTFVDTLYCAAGALVSISAALLVVRQGLFIFELG